MHGLSVFQLLPEHAVKMVVDQVVGDVGLVPVDDIMCNPALFRKQLFPLLSVCHNFRAFVRARFCEYYSIDVDSKCQRNNSVMWLSTSREPKEPGYPSHHLAKKLVLRFDPWAVYTGRAIERLSTPTYNDCSFPLVCELEFCFGINREEYGQYDPSDDDDDDDDDYVERGRFTKPPKRRTSYPLDTLDNIAAFVQRVKEMVPNVRVVRVWTNWNANTLFGPLSAHTTDLAQRLVDIAEAKPTMITHNCTILVRYLNLDLIRDLVRVDYVIHDPSSPILSLLRRNAQSLQHIVLFVETEMLLGGLIRDPDGGGDLVEYPWLHTLELYPRVRTTLSQNDTVNTAVLFPSLRRLNIGHYYPFDDDVLFRGNAATLEYLDIWLSTRIVAILKKYRVFTPTSHPNLQFVRTRHNPDDTWSAAATDAEYLQFALTIAPSAPVRVIADLTKLNEVPGLFGICANIQTLSLHEALLTIWDAMTIIKSLPSLSRLITWPPALGTLPQGASMATLPDYVRSTYSSISKKFRYWYIVGGISSSPNPGLATCILLLALVCPNFVLPPLWYPRNTRFIEEITKQIDKPCFKRDAPRLLRLLSN
ncbi:hypothetical protein GGI21_000680 [Coemansia aciculifera]|nr:hypothetical protein GGI21_000680 [Coemansia aciculifera]